MTTTSLDTLYEGAVSYLVADSSKANAWESVCKFTHQCIQAGMLHDMIEAEFVRVEEQIKLDYALKNMPSSWRSAKSVALGAMRHGYLLVQPDATATPKTVLDKLLKTAKKATKFVEAAVPTPVETESLRSRLIDQVLAVERDMCALSKEDKGLLYVVLSTTTAKLMEQMEDM